MALWKGLTAAGLTAAGLTAAARRGQRTEGSLSVDAAVEPTLTGAGPPAPVLVFAPMGSRTSLPDPGSTVQPKGTPGRTLHCLDPLAGRIYV
jgi:hypothetical protein